MDNSLLVKGSEAVSLFCRLNLNVKKDIPVRSSEMGLLIFIAKSETPVTPLLAADFFKVSKPMIAVMIASLAKNGYITKSPSKDDKRSYVLTATAKAESLVENTCEEYLKTMKRLADTLGAEKYELLIDLLSQANEELSKGND